MFPQCFAGRTTTPGAGEVGLQQRLLRGVKVGGDKADQGSPGGVGVGVQVALGLGEATVQVLQTLFQVGQGGRGKGGGR